MADAAKSLDEELTQLRTDLEGAQTTEKYATTKIAALAQLVDEIDKIVAEYRKEQPDLEKAQADLAEYQENERLCLGQILGLTADAVAPTAAAIDSNLTLLTESVKNLETARDDEKKRRDTAVETRDASKARLEKWKKLIATTKARHQQLNGLKGEIAKAHDAGEYAVAYWLLIDNEKFAGRLVEKPEIVPPDKLRPKIEEVWKAYSGSVVTAEKAEVDLKHAEKALADAKAKLVDQTSKREANILIALKKLQPARAAA